MNFGRRNFLVGAAGALAASRDLPKATPQQSLLDTNEAASAGLDPDVSPIGTGAHAFNGIYEGDYLDRIAFPMGGMGAGMICLEGTGTLSKFSLWNHPNLKNSPTVFAALSLKSPVRIALVLEGPLPPWKLYPDFPSSTDSDPSGLANMALGLPRFRAARFKTQFPFASIRLTDTRVPVGIELVGWSPFIPNDADHSSLPVAAVEYTITNTSPERVDAVFSFNSVNFMASNQSQFVDPIGHPRTGDRIKPIKGGFLLYGAGSQSNPWDEGHCAIWVDDDRAQVNHVWFRDTIFSSLQMAWNDVVAAKCYTREALADSASPGATIFVPMALAPGEAKTIKVHIAWHVPSSNVFAPYWSGVESGSFLFPKSKDTYRPWYSGRFPDIHDLVGHWTGEYEDLRVTSSAFSRALYDSTLPPEVLEAVAANLTVLKAPGVLRQVDGRIWGWEGCGESEGIGGYGTPPHVYGIGQAVPHLFADLERGARETEFGADQDLEGRQSDRAALPIRPLRHKELAIYDAVYPFMGVLLFYRDWRISGDTAWLRKWWRRIRSALEYSIDALDPQHQGHMVNPMDAGDLPRWGSASWRMGCYVDALSAAVKMGAYLNEDVESFSLLRARAVDYMQRVLFNGEYFEQHIERQDLAAEMRKLKAMPSSSPSYSPEAIELMTREGPLNQDGAGCNSLGMIGPWLAWVAGLESALDAPKIASHLSAVYERNFKRDLGEVPCLLRYFMGSRGESGLIRCTWPRGAEPSLPHPYASEVWTGVEYMVASHLISIGKVEEGLILVQACRRRYDGRIRNPFDEVEAGHWYARAMASYALLQAFSGARFDAVDGVLQLSPATPGDFRCFISTATGYGTVGVKNGEPFLEVVSGTIPCKEIIYTKRTDPHATA
jgi:hypothetical protein